MNDFTRYSDEAQRRFQNVGACALSEVRRTFDKIPNCRVDDEDFDLALKKAKVQPLKDKFFGRDSALPRDAIFRIAAELDKQVRQRFEAAADRQAQQRMAGYENEDKVLERKSQFEQAKLNTAALVAAGIIGGNDDE